MMRKKHLSKQQTRQIQKNQQHLPDADTLATGVITAHFGGQLTVQITALPPISTDHATDAEDPSRLDAPCAVPVVGVGAILRCHTRANLPALSAGDAVRVRLDPKTHTGCIEQLLPRHTLISRPDRYHKLRPVASNVSVLVIVFAPLPKPAASLIDRYLVVAKLSNVTPLLVLNKADLLANHDLAQELFTEYETLGKTYGFDTLMTSDVDGTGMDELTEHLHGKLAVFAGQSGVGKSSLINRLLSHSEQSTGELSTISQLGQHTTTTSRLLPFDPQDLGKGGVIDTPGIREYGLWHLTAQEILAGFAELHERTKMCQFRDCNHAPNAKGCALWQAVETGEVLARRVLSFNELASQASTKSSKG